MEKTKKAPKKAPKKSLRDINEEFKEASARRSALLIDATRALAEGAKPLPFVDCIHPMDLWISYGPYHVRCRLCNATCDRYGSNNLFTEA